MEKSYECWDSKLACVFKWSLFETLQNTWKAPGLLKWVGFDVANLSVPSGDGFEENSSVAL